MKQANRYLLPIIFALYREKETNIEKQFNLSVNLMNDDKV